MRLLEGLVLEVRPMPVLATFLAMYLAFLQSGAAMSPSVLLYFPCIFFLLYSVHFLDTYEDQYVRKEDESKEFRFAHGSGGLLNEWELLALAALSSLAFFLILAAISLDAGLPVLLPSFPAWLIGVSYSRFLSRNPFLSIASAPSGVVLSMLGTYLLAAGSVGPEILAYSAPFFLLFLGAMSYMEMADRENDRLRGKPNFSLVIGLRNSRIIGISSLLLGLLISLFNSSPVPAAGIAASLLAGIFFLRAYFTKPGDAVPYVMGGILIFLLKEALL